MSENGHFDVPEEVTFDVHWVMECKVTVRVFDGCAKVQVGLAVGSDYDPFSDGNVWDEARDEWMGVHQVAERLQEMGMTWTNALEAARDVTCAMGVDR